VGETGSRYRSMGGAIIALCAILLVGGSVVRLYESFGPPARGDFKRMWAAAGVFQRGGDPYDTGALTAFSLARGAGETIDLPVYISPAGFPFLLLIAGDSFEGVRYRYLIGAVCVVALMWLVPVIRKPREADPIRRALAFTALVTFFPLLLMWWVGPLSMWPLLGTAICGVLIGRWNAFSPFCGGFALMLLLVKPNCVPLVLPFVIGFCVATKRRSALLGILMGGAIGLYGIVTVSSERSSIAALAETGLWLTPAPLRALGWPMTPLSVRFLPVIVGALAAFIAGLKTHDLCSFSKRLAFIIVPVGLCLSPFAWTYDFTPLVLTIIAMVGSAFGKESVVSTSSTIQLLVIAVILLNVLLGLSPLAMEIHWWYPLGFLVLGILFYRAESGAPGAAPPAMKA